MRTASAGEIADDGFKHAQQQAVGMGRGRFLLAGTAKNESGETADGAYRRMM